MIKRDSTKTYEGNRPKVIMFGDINFELDEKSGDWEPAAYLDKKNTVEILDVQEIKADRIITNKYVLPLSDAVMKSGPEGTVYCYNVGLPYIAESAHLAEVERNIIVGQAYLYAGRNNPLTDKKTPLMMWVLVGFLGVIALVGMFKK